MRGKGQKVCGHGRAGGCCGRRATPTSPSRPHVAQEGTGGQARQVRASGMDKCLPWRSFHDTYVLVSGAMDVLSNTAGDEPRYAHDGVYEERLYRPAANRLARKSRLPPASPYAEPSLHRICWG